MLIKRHALAPFAAPAGLAPTVGCCVVACVYCMALEDWHGLKLAPRLMRELWPPCEQVQAVHASQQDNKPYTSPAATQRASRLVGTTD